MNHQSSVVVLLIVLLISHVVVFAQGPPPIPPPPPPPQPYHGVNTTCSEFMFDSSIPATTAWCNYQNPFATRQRTIVDNRLLSSLAYNVSCVDGVCSSIISIRTVTCNSSSLILLALSDGTIAEYDTYLHTANTLYSGFTINENEKILRFELFDCDQFIVSTETTTQFTLYSLSDTSIVYRTFLKSEFAKLADLQLFESNGTRYVALNLYKKDGTSIIHYIDALSLDLNSIIKWTITGSNNIRMSHFIHHGGFSRDYMAYRPSTNDSSVVSRDLILVSDEKQVRILSFTPEDITINMRDTTSPGIFFVASESDRISAAAVFADSIRRPINNLPLQRITCNNVEFQPAQSIYLALGLVSSGNSSRIQIQLIQEFSFINYAEQGNFSVTNPARRITPFPCRFDEYYNGTACISALRKSNPLSDEAISFSSAFIDVPSLLNNIRGYTPSITLDIEALCTMVGGTLISLNDCLEYARNVSCEMDLFNGNVRNTHPLDILFSTYWQTQIFAVQKDNLISVWSQSFWLGSEFGDFTISSSNLLESSGPIIDLYVSPNGQFIFSSVQRSSYEIEAFDRFNEICTTLETEDNVFLQSYEQLCKTFSYDKMQLGDFTLIATNCPDYVWCPTFSDSVIMTAIQPGLFLLRPFEILPCLPGYYCLNGVALPCPVGMHCNTNGTSLLSKPSECSIKNRKPGYTCYHEGLAEPVDVVSAGLITTAMSLRPIPVPPGSYMKASKIEEGVYSIDDIHDCSPGDYCALSRVVIDEDDSHSLNSLHCPELTYCPSTDVLEPTICRPNDTMIMCLEGSSAPTICPAGYYCSSLLNKTECSPREYCPEGSFSSKVCAAGYYCPETSVQIPCPKGYYCPEGSLQPIGCSWFFSFCQEKSQHDALTPSGIAILIVIIGAILLVSSIYSMYSYYRRQNAERKRQKTNMRQVQSPSSFGFHVDTDYDDNFDIVEVSQTTDQELEDLDNDSLILTPEEPTVELRRQEFYLDLKFKNLGLVVRSTGGVVLKGVTGEIKHGQLTCVLGQSGAGKSSFLTTLAGRAYYGKTIGDVFINGQKTKIQKYNRVLGFVRQDDIMIPTMTVEETLYFAARTRLDWKIKTEEVMKIVDNVIDVLRLHNIRHSIIGDEENRGISGGQRKRVNVGIELVSQPVALMCDEPTSGLDSASSKELCEALKNIARSGVNVMAVIHQPRYEIFQSFEHVLLLGLGGRTVYLGPVNAVEAYFEMLGYEFPAKVNPADYLLDITSGIAKPQREPKIELELLQVVPENLPTIWELYNSKEDNNEDQMISNTESVNNEEPTYHRPEFSTLIQWYMCFKRASVQQLRSIPSILLDLLLVWIGGLIIAISFRDKNYIGPMPKQMQNLCPESMRALCSVPLQDPLVSISMMFNLTLALTGCMSALRCFGRERLIFNKESESGLSTIAYCIAKDIAMIPAKLLAPLVFLAVFYSIQVSTKHSN
jgi:ABC-type multidrug transport system ATPase subunit